jgi:protein SCO1/2
MPPPEQSDVSGARLPAYGGGASGQVRPLKPTKGKLMLVYFGYLSCPDVCPTTMSSLSAAVRTLPKSQREELEFGMVTADPKRDSGEDILRYLGHFFPGLAIRAYRTTDVKQLEQVETKFGAASEIDPHKPGAAYSVSHTAFLYAVDRKGEMLVMWPFGALSDDIAADLKKLLDQQ